MTEGAPRTVWFHRGFAPLGGGQVKHSHYFEHVRRTPGFAPMITFSREAPNAFHACARRSLWPVEQGERAERWEPAAGDLLFLAGVDWRYLAECGRVGPMNPRINLIQGVQHAREDNELYAYLAERAVRICVSPEVAAAISATGRTRGPVLTIPNGSDVTPFEVDEGGSPRNYERRRHRVIIVGYKRPELARRLSERLCAQGVEHLLPEGLLERNAFLGLLSESRVAVCLSFAEEGFYLPALEAMAAGCLVVTMDGIGNRGFCRHGNNCLVADPSPDSLLEMTCRALAMPAPERGLFHHRARVVAARHSLDAERARFQAVLGDIDALWRMA